MRRTILALSALCAVVIGTWPPFPGKADVAVITVPLTGTYSTTASSGNLFNPGVVLGGQARCTLNLVDTSTASVTVTGTGDGTHYVTNTSFGSSGVISVTSTQSQTSGDVSQYPKGFNATITANAGTLTYSVSCGPAQTASSGGGGNASPYPSAAPTDANGNVKTAIYSPLPLPVTITAQPVQVTIPTPTASSVPVYVVNGATPTAYPTASIGPSPTAAPVVNSQGECYVISSSGQGYGNMAPDTCDTNGARYIDALLPIEVFQPCYESCALYPAVGTAPFTSTTCTLVSSTYYASLYAVMDMSTGSEGSAVLKFYLDDATCSANDIIASFTGLGFGSMTLFPSFQYVFTSGHDISMEWSATPSGSGVRVLKY